MHCRYAVGGSSAPAIPYRSRPITRSGSVWYVMAGSAAMSEFDELLQAFGVAGGDRNVLENRNVAHMVVVGHKILSARDVEGLEVEAHETHDGITAMVRVRDGVKIDHPV